MTDTHWWLCLMLLSRTFAATPLDKESIPQSNLDIAERVRTNQLPWKRLLNVSEVSLDFGSLLASIFDMDRRL